MNYKLLIIAGAMIFLSACSSVQQDTTIVMPKANHHYVVIATAGQQQEATRTAINKAQYICEQKQKSIIVISNQEKYLGSGKELAAVTKMAHEASFMNGLKTYVPTTSTDQDYQAKVEFKCQ